MKAPRETTEPGNPANVREMAHGILLRVDQAGAFASILLDQAEPRLGDRRDAALLHEIVLGVLRRQAILDHVISGASDRPTGQLDPELLVALRVGAYQLLFLDRVPDFAAVNSAVNLVKGSRRKRVSAAAGLANAVLRRVAKRGADALPTDDAPLALRHSHPGWWVDRLVQRLGHDRAEAVLQANNRPAATVLCTNPRRGTQDAVAAQLADEGVTTRPGPWPGALRVESGSVAASRVLAEGEAWVQDEASQLVVGLLGDRVGPRVVDLCAAPGSKTAQLAAALSPGGLVVAVDRHLGRLRRLTRLMNRTGAESSVQAVNADMTARSPVRGPFDQVLVDAPCSGTGTMRRHPEIRWRLSVEDLKLLAARQGRLLQAGASMTAPGGSLLYSVCSVEPEEGEAVVGDFLERHPEFRVEDPTDRLPAPHREGVDSRGFLRTWPDRGELDGFFAVKMVRNT